MENDRLRTYPHPEALSILCRQFGLRSCTDSVHALVDQNGLSETLMGSSILNPARGDEHSQEIRGSI